MPLLARMSGYGELQTLLPKPRDFCLSPKPIIRSVRRALLRLCRVTRKLLKCIGQRGGHREMRCVIRVELDNVHERWRVELTSFAGCRLFHQVGRIS
jgi:hypothetical protein